ncbi:MAG: hypothetical protein Q3979_04265 [Actinomycetaceae bacterium]|nr:hypothetical protein [Actinomycetaceae bacterium]
MRQGAVWIADWPVTAAELAGEVPPDLPAIVLGSKGVVSANAWAHERGVRPGMPRRFVHSTCPEAAVVLENRERDVARFEPVLRAIDGHVAQVTAFDAGSVVFAVQGAIRTAGSCQALVEALIGDIAQIADCEAHVGIAEGTLATLVAARSDLVLEEGRSQEFLDEQPVSTILLATGPSMRAEVEHCLDLLEHLGVHTLGGVTALGATSLTNRFGRAGHFVWALASGHDIHLAPREGLASCLACSRVFEPPVERAQDAAFAARVLAEELSAAMRERAFSGGRLTIVASMEDGTELSHSWAIDGGGARDIVDRVRWQLSSWGQASNEAGALARLDLRLEQAAAAKHESLWGSGRSDGERVPRAVARMQALAGEEAVRVPRKVGGRSADGRYVESLWGEVLERVSRAELPWPGSIPEPDPVAVHPTALAVAIMGDCGHELHVTGEGHLACSRGCEACAPAVLRLPRGPVSVSDYAGPWPVSERWWDPSRCRRRAYMQVVHRDGACLVYCEAGAWYEEARYG